MQVQAYQVLDLDFAVALVKANVTALDDLEKCVELCLVERLDCLHAACNRCQEALRLALLQWTLVTVHLV